MKKLMLIVAATLIVSGCYKDPQSISTEGKDFKVEFLFEKDGIKIYRFLDGGRYHYFTTLGETMSTRSNGKNSHREENIR